MNVFGLMQLTQVSTAAGEGYYLGAQKVLRCGGVQREAELAGFVEGALEAAIGPADGIASGISFRSARQGDLGAIPVVCGARSKDEAPAEIRLASVQMGQRLWEVSRHWDWAGAVHEQLDPLVGPGQLHHAVAFGALVSETTSSQVRAIATYLFHVARQMIWAAVRFVPLEEAAGPRVLSAVQPGIARLAAACADKGVGDMGRFE